MGVIALRRHGQKLIWFAFGAMLGSFSLASLPSANSATSCGNQVNSHEGAFRLAAPQAGWLDGAKADIEVRRPDLCPVGNSNYTDSTAWSMLVSNALHGYAQIGYLRHNNGDLENFVEHDTAGFDRYFYTFGDPDPGDQKKYYVARYDGDEHLHMLVCAPEGGGSCLQWGETSWDPHNRWPEGSFAQFMGETQHKGDDIPGTQSNKAGFTDVQEKQLDDDWVYGNLTHGSDGVNAYQFDFQNQTRWFRIWTHPVNR